MERNNIGGAAVTSAGIAALEGIRETARRRLEAGETPGQVRARMERVLTGLLSGRAENDPGRADALAVHPAMQRAVEQTIQEWEAERDGEV